MTRTKKNPPQVPLQAPGAQVLPQVAPHAPPPVHPQNPPQVNPQGSPIDVDGNYDPSPYKEARSRQKPYLPEMEVGRMFLECGDSGDLFSTVDKIAARIKVNGQWTPEEWLWRCFKCLVEAISVLENGREDPRLGPLPGWKRIVHFDLKPDNG